MLTILRITRANYDIKTFPYLKISVVVKCLKMNKLAHESLDLAQCPSKTRCILLSQIRLPEVDGRSVNVMQSGCYFVQNFQLEQTKKTVAKFENASELRCAWMNKFAPLMSNFNQICKLPTRSKAFIICF